MATEITLTEFATIVKQMRKAQVEFFKFGRNKRDLAKSIQLESKVDQLLKEIPTNEREANYLQSNLFI